MSDQTIDPDSATPADLRPWPWPWHFNVSGRYQWVGRWGRRPPVAPVDVVPLDEDEPRSSGADAAPDESTQGAWPLWISSETIRLDVDGRYPQMTVSGDLRSGVVGRVHWIAEVRLSGRNTWAGAIWYRDGMTRLMPFTDVKISATRSFSARQRAIKIQFLAGGTVRRTRTYKWQSAYFDDVEFEYDCTSDATVVTSINTCDHPNRPVSMACENISLEDVYRRAGFRTSLSGGGGDVPLTGAGSNGTWSDAELHDATVAYWSRFADRPQWALWVFWCALHDRGTSLGGIMFDDIGPNHRQGTAIFTESFIKDPPAGEPAVDRAAWVARMRFWTAAHEMGHAFNLAHAWQKEHPPTWGTPWIPIANEPESRSFMNYPFRVAGGQQAFFADFENRFTDQELMFMRHAPRQFVQMGNADWFENHGFEQVAPAPAGIRLEIRANRERPVFEFMEPVVLELKLANEGDRMVVVEKTAMLGGNDLTVIIHRDGGPARQWGPYAKQVRHETPTPLAPGEARYVPLMISAGLNGADLAEPGLYTVQVALDLDDGTVVSNPYRLRVSPPKTWDEEDLAGDFFVDEVGRALALGGTRVMASARNTLENVVDQLPGSHVALHARVALASPQLRPFKYLDVTHDTPQLAAAPAQTESATGMLSQALIEPGAEAADTFGHVLLHDQVDRLTAVLEDEGATAEAADAQQGLRRALDGRGVLDRVLNEIARKERELRPTAKKASRKKRE